MSVSLSPLVSLHRNPFLPATNERHFFSNSTRSRTWPITSDQPAFRPLIHAQAGQPIRIPYNGSARTVTYVPRAFVQLLSSLV
jgi:hypothetical protein